MFSKPCFQLFPPLMAKFRWQLWISSIVCLIDLRGNNNVAYIRQVTNIVAIHDSPL